MAIVPGSAHGTLVRNFVFPNIGKTASIDPTLSTTKATIGARTRTGRRRQIATSFRPIGNPETRRSTRQERPQYIPDFECRLAHLKGVQTIRVIDHHFGDRVLPADNGADPPGSLALCSSSYQAHVW